MKIALYGAMANNMYVLAQAMAEAGASVSYVRQWSDSYCMSQPLWQDVEMRLTPRQAVETSHWGRVDWLRLEQERQWLEPNFYVDPLKVRESAGPVRSGLQRQLKSMATSTSSLMSLEGSLQALATADVVIACGVEGLQLASMAGRKYVFWPHGGDIRLALQSPRTVLKEHSLGGLRTALRLRRALAGTEAIATQDPTAVTCGLVPAPSTIRRLSLPVPSGERGDRANRVALLDFHVRRLGERIPEASTYILMPSRIDQKWKGNQRVLKALRSVSARDVHVIALGWGNDRDWALREFSDLSGKVTFVDRVVSKPILRSLMASVDLVADQFVLGTFGTSAVEAMALGCPVMMYINDSVFRARGWEPPPVLNARTEEEISGVLRGVVADPTLLDVAGLQAKSWFERSHDRKVVVPATLGWLDEVCS